MVFPLSGVIRNYSWGSRQALARMEGREVPSPHPEAEMWFGAHPGGPATVDSEPLDVLIASDSVAALGRPIAMKYGANLPFLLKLLAADAPLSLQAHPTKEQAEEGFAREDTLGIDRDALERNYKDDNHKPELIVALTEFHAMCGFRPVERTLTLFDELGVPELDRYRAMIADVVASEGLRSLLTTWITLPSGPRSDLVQAVAAGAARYVESGKKDFDLVAANLVELAKRYPSDPGVLCALLLNHIKLNPGEGIYLDAGQLHAYVRGFGVEIMANSDNVLRGGLTSKHIDVPELVRILTFEPLQEPLAVCRQVDGLPDGVKGFTYQTPAPEFVLYRFEVEPGAEFSIDRRFEGVEGQLALNGPAVALGTAGELVLSSGEEDGFGDLAVQPSKAAWIPAEQEDLTVHNKSDQAAQFFLATVRRI